MIQLAVHQHNTCQPYSITMKNKRNWQWHQKKLNRNDEQEIFRHELIKLDHFTMQRSKWCFSRKQIPF